MLTAEMRCSMYRQVRAILVRHWFDLGYLNIHLGTNALTLSGTLRKVAGVREAVHAESLNELMAELRRIPGVRQVYVDLENFRQKTSNETPSPHGSIAGPPAAPGEAGPPEGTGSCGTPGKV